MKLPKRLICILLGEAEIGRPYVLGKSNFEWRLENRNTLIIEGFGQRKKYDLSQVALRQPLSRRRQ